MNVIGYTRVSTEEQAAHGVSIAMQADKIRGQCQVDDLTLITIIEDAGQSAKTLNRPGLTRALAMLQSGEAEGLVIYKLDRLSRSVVDMGYLCETYFKKTHALLSVTDKIDTKTAGGILVLNVIMSVAQWERETIGERTKAAMVHLKGQGVHCGRRSRAMVDPGAFSFAKGLRSQGISYPGIAKELTLAGYQPAESKTWAESTVRYMLRGATYDDKKCTCDPRQGHGGHWADCPAKPY